MKRHSGIVWDPGRFAGSLRGRDVRRTSRGWGTRFTASISEGAPEASVLGLTSSRCLGLLTVKQKVFHHRIREATALPREDVPSVESLLSVVAVADPRGSRPTSVSLRTGACARRGRHERTSNIRRKNDLLCHNAHRRTDATTGMVGGHGRRKGEKACI